MLIRNDQDVDRSNWMNVVKGCYQIVPVNYSARILTSDDLAEDTGWVSIR
jgi:hypothetical protein